MSVLKKLATVAPVLGLVLGLTLGAERPASASVLDFEGLDVDCNASTAATGTVPAGYGGLNWSAYSIGFGATDVSVECDANYQGPSFQNTYGQVTPLGSYAAYNTSSFGEIDASIGAGTFTYGGAWFSSFAYLNFYDDPFLFPYGAYSLTVNGYKPGDAIGSPTYTDSFDLSSTQYDYHAAGWSGLNLLAFLAGDGLYNDQGTTFGGDGRAFLMDNLDVRIEEHEVPVPEPASMLLLGTGLVAVVRARKRLQPQRVEILN